MSSDNIQVAIRVRPFIEQEDKEKIHWQIQKNQIFQVDDNGQKINEVYSFDHIFKMDKSNSDIYSDIVKKFVKSSMDGLNSTIFAYGQTSSGKTYTMMGDEKNRGIMSLAIDDIFELIQNTSNRKYLLRVSYIEIYSEKINDLLDPSNKVLRIRETHAGTIVLQDAKEEIVTTKQQVLECLKVGTLNRQVGETLMNEKSSRSHTIFRILIESIADSSVQVSTLNLVDLAGSERVSQTKATNLRFREGVTINKSLSTLGLVIKQLSEGQEFVNFRDSKLTRLLQHSLGGNAKTLIIATITLAYIDDTHSTLSFAQRAKTVKNKPEIIEIVTDAEKTNRYAKLNSALQKKLKEELAKNRELEKIKDDNSKEILRLQEQMQMLEIFQNGKGSIENSGPKRRHTIGYAERKPFLQSISEEETENTGQLDPLTVPMLSLPPQTLSPSTPKSVLRTRCETLEKDYDELLAFTRDEKMVRNEYTRTNEELTEKLKLVEASFSEMKKQKEVDEEIIRSQLRNNFKRREAELIGEIENLQQQLAQTKISNLERPFSSSNIPGDIYNDIIEDLYKLQNILNNNKPLPPEDLISTSSDNFNHNSREMIGENLIKQINSFCAEQLNKSIASSIDLEDFNNTLLQESDLEIERVHLNDLNNKIIVLQNDNSILNSQLEKLKLDLQDKHLEITALTNLNDDLKRDVKTLKTNIDDLKINNDTNFNCHQIKSLKEQIQKYAERDVKNADLKAKIVDLKVKFDESCLKIKALEKDIEIHREENEKYLEKIKYLEDVNIKYENAIKDGDSKLKKNLDESSLKVRNLEMQIELYKEENAKHSKKIEDLVNINLKYKNDLKDSHSKMKNCGDKVEDLQNQVNLQKHQIHNLIEEIQEYKKRDVNDADLKAEINLEIADYKVKLNESCLKIKALEKALEIQREENEKHVEKIRCLKDVNITYENEVKDCDSKLKNKLEIICDLKKNLDESSLKVSCLEMEIKVYKEENRKHSKKIEDLVNINLKYENDLKIAHSKLENCGDQLNLQKQQIHNLKVEIQENKKRDVKDADLKAKINLEIADYKVKLNESCLKIKALEKELEIQREKNEKHLEKIEQYSAEIKLLNEKNVRYDKSICNSQSDLEEAYRKIKNLEAELSQQKKHSESYLSDIQFLRSCESKRKAFETFVLKVLDHFVMNIKRLLTSRNLRADRKSLENVYVQLKKQMQCIRENCYDLNEVYNNVQESLLAIVNYSNAEETLLQRTDSCQKCKKLQEEVEQLDQRVKSGDLKLTETLAKLCELEKTLLTGRSESFPCLDCKELRRRNKELMSEYVDLQVKMFDQQDAKVEAQTSDALKYYQERDKRQREQIERYERSAKKKEEEKNCRSVDVQCDIMLAENYDKLKKLCIIRKDKIIQLESQLQNMCK